MDKKSGAVRFFEIYKKNLEKQQGRKKSKIKKIISPVLLAAVGILAVGLLVFTPQRMIIGTWEYDFDESYMFYYGEKVEMGWPLYGTLSFANETQMATGGTYYINREELGIKPFGQGNYTRFKVSSITPNKLILIEGDPLMGTSYTYNVYRKK